MFFYPHCTNIFSQIHSAYVLIAYKLNNLLQTQICTILRSEPIMKILFFFLIMKNLDMCLKIINFYYSFFMCSNNTSIIPERHHCPPGYIAMQTKIKQNNQPRCTRISNLSHEIGCIAYALKTPNSSNANKLLRQ